jgi:ankyrin repeat protein
MSLRRQLVGFIAVYCVIVVAPLLIAAAKGRSLWPWIVVGIIVTVTFASAVIQEWISRAISGRSACSNSWTSNALQRGDIAAIESRVLDDPTYLRSVEDGGTPLKLAVMNDHLALLNFMLEHGADPTAEIDRGQSSLMEAVFSEEPNSRRILSRLIQAGVNVCFNGYGSGLCTPLHYAADDGDVDKARMLLDAGACVNERAADLDRRTPLMDAAFWGRPDMVRLLIERGADPTMQNACGSTAFEVAKQSLDPAIRESLAEMRKQAHQKLLNDLAKKNVPCRPETRERFKTTFAKLAEKQHAKDLACRDGRKEVICILKVVTPNSTACVPEC